MVKTLISGRDGDFLQQRNKHFLGTEKKAWCKKDKEIDNISYAIVASPCCTFLGQVTLTSVLRLMALILLWRSKHVRRRHKTRNSTTETKVNTMECREKFSGLGEAAGT